MRKTSIVALENVEGYHEQMRTFWKTERRWNKTGKTKTLPLTDPPPPLKNYSWGVWGGMPKKRPRQYPHPQRQRALRTQLPSPGREGRRAGKSHPRHSDFGHPGRAGRNLPKEHAPSGQWEPRAEGPCRGILQERNTLQRRTLEQQAGETTQDRQPGQDRGQRGLPDLAPWKWAPSYTVPMSSRELPMPKG